MVSSGVQSIRVAFNWAAAQPYASSADQLPADQASPVHQSATRPTDFSQTDEIVGDAASADHGPADDPLCAVMGRPAQPRGDRRTQARAPLRPYAAAAGGTLRAEGQLLERAIPRSRGCPIRMWQIWNEPNLSYYWPQPFAKSYVPCWRRPPGDQARRSGGQGGAGALTDFAWRSIGQIYKIHGARNLFDIVAVNGFTKTPANVILYMRLMRRAMIRDGDGHKPMLATEISWPSSRGTGTPGLQLGHDPGRAGAQHRRPAADARPAARRARADRLLLLHVDRRREPSVHPRLGASQVCCATSTAPSRPNPPWRAFRKGALALERCRQQGQRRHPLPQAGPLARQPRVRRSQPSATQRQGRGGSSCLAQSPGERRRVGGRGAGETVDAVPLLAVGRIPFGRVPGVEQARRQPAVEVAERVRRREDVVGAPSLPGRSPVLRAGVSSSRTRWHRAGRPAFPARPGPPGRP